MTRMLQHTLFWFGYLLFYINMEYTWVGNALPDQTFFQLLPSMVISVGGIMLPEIIFAYYILYKAGQWPSKNIRSKLIDMLLTVIVFAACVIMVKLLGNYIINNWVYEKKLARKETWDFAILLRSVIYFGFSSGLALSLKLFRKYKKASEREKLLADERLSVELKLLRNQLHPHFLFNTLNNIYSLTRKKSDMAPDAVLKLSDLLDFMLYRSETDTIPLANEIKFLEDFIALEKIRYSDRLSIHFIKNIDDPSTKIIPLVLLPLVENAFKHGVSETQNEIFIHIKIVQKDEEIFFSIENSYDSIGCQSFNRSIGLKNVSRRLKLLYKKHTINILPLPNFFKVDLYLDLKSYGKA